VELKKLNPLFLDSTKPIGDNYVANVELTNVILYDGELLFFEMIDQFGMTQRFSMKMIETKKSTKYFSEIWLKKEQQIKYRFVIMRNGQDIYFTSIQSEICNQQISEKWESDFSLAVVKQEKTSSRKSVRDSKPSAAKTLCTPYLTEQLKLLIDDLL